jgi:hypothetical protein
MRLLAKTRVYVQRATDFCSGGISGGKQKKTRTTGITTTSQKISDNKTTTCLPSWASLIFCRCCWRLFSRQSCGSG